MPFGEFVFNSINNGGTDTLDARANIRLGKSNLATAGFEFENETLFQRFMSSFCAPAGSFAKYGSSVCTVFAATCIGS